ncbi:uncharacterized protein METZ01_LOCUS14362 [marine metagenome]|uniref:Uncharacterized protein n=1 Tax=marine metagenome TaxID=408172 RepID=A0A381P5M4_9ZZZZ
MDSLLLLVGGVGREKQGSNIPKRVNSGMLLVQQDSYFRKDAPCFACKA